MPSGNNKYNNIDWTNVIKKDAIGTDGLDLGQVHEVGDTYIIIQKGLINKKRYTIPISSAESFDGETLKLRVSEGELNGFKGTDGQKFGRYSLFKPPDISKEIQTKKLLIKENFEITKNIVEGKVHIIKAPIMETKTVEIDLTREIITIERRSMDKNSSVYDPSIQSSDHSSSIEGPVESRIVISIPLKREEPVITKIPYVKEEIIVKKKPITQTKTIAEDMISENIKYDNKLNNDLNE
jgi:uncharacterized protein (TIGR02271 family)